MAKRKGMRADKRFEYKGRIGTDIHGKPQYKSFYSTIGKRDAKSKWEAYMDEQRASELYGTQDIQSYRGFRSWALEWLEVYKRPQVSAASYQNTYLPEVLRLCEFFGEAKLTAIRPLDVQKFFNSKRDMSESRLKKQRFLLNAIFESAIDNDLCFKNPAKNVKYTSTQVPAERRALSDEQIDRYKAIATGSRDDALFMLLTGIRRGEMLGLMWTDYDPHKRELRIQRSVGLEGYKVTINPPKWDSYRTLPLDQESCEVLNRQPRKSLYIFPSVKNEVRNPNTFSHTYRIWAEKNLPEDLRVSPHELRHTYGTKLRRDGVDIYTIQKLLGHKSIDVTTEIYVHAETDALRKSVERARTQSDEFLTKNISTESV